MSILGDTPNEWSNTTLLRRAERGDPAAFEELIERFGDNDDDD